MSISDERLRSLAAYPGAFTPSTEVAWAADMRSALTELQSLRAAAKVRAIREGDGEVELRLALEAIERIIRENIRDNGTDIDRMNIGGEWHTGPVVDASFRILRGLQRIAAQALAAIPATGGEKE